MSEFTAETQVVTFLCQLEVCLYLAPLPADPFAWSPQTQLEPPAHKHGAQQCVSQKL